MHAFKGIPTWPLNMVPRLSNLQNPRLQFDPSLSYHAQKLLQSIWQSQEYLAATHCNLHAITQFQ